MPHPLPPRPTRDPKDPPRSIDAYFEEAHSSTSGSHHVRLGFWLIFFSLGVANSGDATEIGAMNYILSSPGFGEEMLGPSSGDFAGRGAAIASSVFAGMLIGGVVTGALGDRTGRRPILLSGLVINATAGAASAFSPSAAALCLCRFVGGLGIGAVLSSLLALAAELSPPSRRGFCVTFVASFWSAGQIYVAALAMLLFGERGASWRVFALVAAAPCAVGGVLVWAVVPESARFLALRGRYGDAARVANVVADGMGYRGAAIEAEEVRHHFEAEAANAKPPVTLPRTLSRMQSGLQHTKEAARGVRRLYGKDLILRSTLPLQIVWATMSFGSGLCTWITKIFESIDPTSMYLHSLYFALANVPGNIAATLLVDRIGRKRLLVVSMMCASLSLFVFADAASDSSGGKDRPVQVMLGACIFHAFLVMGWCSISCMTTELFPTDVRGAGSGICAASGRIAAMLVQFVNGALIGRPGMLLSVAAGSIMVGAVAPAAFRVEETGGTHLHDRTGDGKATVVMGATAAVSSTEHSHVGHVRRRQITAGGMEITMDGSSDPIMLKNPASEVVPSNETDFASKEIV
uniref:Major facilitator superfamily (MFS) profile domain-containing protein n=1 Tax=Odontella aurita TaxID=265563 RepID=A0A7S4N5S7_9STRA